MRKLALAKHVRPAAAAFAFACMAAASAAQLSGSDTSIGALKQMSVEQLMDIEVTSVAKQPEKLLDAASSIDVITGDEISRYGATSIPQALQLADNLEVAQENSHDWAISARGFNTNLADKLLVLMDGRAVYSPLYGGVLWNVQDYLLEDVDRIEVISGPGGTLWGANAVNGVINIISKSARDTQGLYLEGGGGNELQGLAAFRYGGTLAPDVYYRFYAQYTDRGSEDLPDGQSANDSIRMGRAGFRLDSYAEADTHLTLQGDFYSGQEQLGPALGDANLGGGNLLGRWTRSLPNDGEASLQAYFDDTHLTQPFAASPASPPYYTGFALNSLVDNLDTYDVDFQYRLHPVQSQTVIWGLGYRFSHEMDTDLSVVRFNPSAIDLNLYSAFVQDEFALASAVHLTLGTKVEHNDYTGFEWEPSGRLRWDLTDKQMLWAAVSRAVRTPSRYDRDLDVVTGLVNAPAPYVFPASYLAGSEDFRSESVLAYELGYRAELTSRASVSLSAFYNVYDNVRGTGATPVTADYPFPFPIVFNNDLEGHTYGLEATADYQLLDWWQLHAGYDLLREDIHAKPGYVDATGALNETADPKNQVFLRSSMDLPHRLELDLAARWIDSLRIDSGPTGGPVAGMVPSYAELDARVGWRAGRDLEISLVGQNLLHGHHPEYGYPSASREEIERGIYGKVEWRH
jgi:iron complex outermembrane receptor protein